MMLDIESDSPAAVSKEPTRRRRTASRPAGPPKEIPATQAPAPAALEKPELPKPLPELTAPSEEVGASTPRRRRTTRARAAKATVGETIEATAEPAPAQAVGALTEAQVEAPVEPVAKQAPARRRSTRKAPVAKQDATPEDVEGAAAPTESQQPDALAEVLATMERAALPVEGEIESEEEPPELEDRDEILHSLAEAIAQADDDAQPRRRRRRGGRRRRRGSHDDNGDSADDASDDNDNGVNGDDDDADADDEAPRSTRRRRRRRRRGEDATGDDEPGTEVVVKVREPRRSKESDEVTGIEGSTRIEAKRQRRRESRAAGRRRAPILSEAEFLARRESVDRKLLIRQHEDYTQLAVLEDDVLVEHYVDRASAASLIGNIYLGKVQNVLPSMEAVFIDIGRSRNAVLYAGEIDWEGLGHTGERKVEAIFKSGQSVLVQVSKDPVGAKGARLTSHISLPGRYLVYSPSGHLSGVSRKLSDVERNRLKDILGSLIGEEASVIVRTAAEGVSEDELVRDVNRLKAQWGVIEKKSKQGSSPQALYAEPDLTLRIVRDLFTEDFKELIVQGDDAFDAISAYVGHIAPHLAERLHRFEQTDESNDCFSKYRVDEQIAKALERKVFLPSGGSLIIERTEAMTVVDVNTGKFTGAGGNLEATVTSNNLEAAEELVRQLRLRDIGGIIVVDFVDMVLPANRELLMRRLVECLGRDRTRHQVAEVTSLGLVQLTRKKIGTGLAEAFTEQCDCCRGRGYHRFDEPTESQAQADGGERPQRRRRGRN